MTLAFVYGTLKGLKTRFGPGSTLAESEFVGHGVTVDDFNLISGGFPIAILPTDKKAIAKFNGKILGEVYAISKATCDGLDAYEGYPNYYTRSVHTIKLLKGGECEAWIYTGRDVNASIGYGSRFHISPDNNGELYWPYESEIPLPT